MKEPEAGFLTNRTRGLFQSQTRTPPNNTKRNSMNMAVLDQADWLTKVIISFLYSVVETSREITTNGTYGLAPNFLSPGNVCCHMEPKRAFAERLHVISTNQVQEPDKQYRGIVEFEDGDQYRFMTNKKIKEDSWCTVIGTFEEEHGKTVSTD